MKSILLLALAALALPLGQLRADPDDTTIYELRIYHANPGKLDALHARFRDHTVGFFEKHGMGQIGYFVPVDNEESNILVYWLAFEDKAAQEKAWVDFRGDPEWKKVYAESTKDGKLVAKVDSTLLHGTAYSPEIGKLINKGDTRLFEWRTYTTNEGKLPNLHARFRDHTCALFEKHGITNLGYWTYAAGQEGAGTTLTYLVAHPNQATRDANFKAFGGDPDWKKARAESEKAGPILIKGGVHSVMLTPTDYSPTKE